MISFITPNISNAETTVETSNRYSFVHESTQIQRENFKTNATGRANEYSDKNPVDASASAQSVRSKADNYDYIDLVRTAKQPDYIQIEKTVSQSQASKHGTSMTSEKVESSENPAYEFEASDEESGNNVTNSNALRHEETNETIQFEENCVYNHE